MAAFSIPMSSVMSPYPKPACCLPYQLAQPVLAAELASNQEQFAAVLHPLGGNNDQVETALSRNTYLDFGFILAYAAFLWFLAGALAAPSRPVLTRLLIVVAAAADVAEDIGILTDVSGPSDNVALLTSVVSRIKWGSLAAVFLLLALLMARRLVGPFDRTGSGLLAILSMGAAVFGLTGLWPESPWFPGFLSYDHLTVFVGLFSLIALVILVATVAQRFVTPPDPIEPVTR
jgi:hypothetical protein